MSIYQENETPNEVVTNLIDIDTSSTDSIATILTKFRNVLTKIDKTKPHELIVNIVGGKEPNTKNDWGELVHYINEKNELGFNITIVIRGTIHLSVHLPLLSYKGVTLHSKLKIVWDRRSNNVLVKFLKHDEQRLRKYFDYFAKELVEYKHLTLNVDSLENLGINNYDIF